jgi:hypothetical protein
MKKRLFLTLATFFLLTACDKNDDVTKNVLTEDQQILKKVYSPAYMYPPGFKYEKFPGGSVYYENTVSVGTSQTMWMELTTNDKQQAKYWSEVSGSSNAYYRNDASVIETEKFFEVKRVLSNKPSDIILSRVHKSSYFIPTIDKLRKLPKIGILKISPINKSTVKDFIEYAWTNNLIGYSGKVLENTIADYPNKVVYSLKSISITPGDWGLNAMINVVNFDFSVDKTSGEVSYETNEVKQIEGNRNDIQVK